MKEREMKLFWRFIIKSNFSISSERAATQWLSQLSEKRLIKAKTDLETRSSENIAERKKNEMRNNRKTQKVLPPVRQI